jgi:protein-disulfide isomerase
MEVEPQLIRQYIETGRARLVYRHLLQLGDGSRTLAQASECAGDQGKFWEMRELVYRRQNQLGSASAAALTPLVEELGLDNATFTQCLESGQFRQQVDQDYAAAEREGITNRPVMDINSTRIIGAQPFAQFQRAVDAAK